MELSALKQALYVMADELRGMATVGDIFAGNVYERERAERIMQMAAKLVALADENHTPDVLAAIFDERPWHRISPAIGVEAAVFDPEGKLLLIQRADNAHWCVPGGLAEIGETFAEASLRELWEEAGMRGRVVRLMGLFDGRLWGSRAKVHLIHPVFRIECDDLTPHPGSEALAAGFFDRGALPIPLHRGHSVRIPKLFELRDSPGTYFDAADSTQAELSTQQRPAP